MNKALLASIALALVAALAPSYAQQWSDDNDLPLSRATTLAELKLAQMRGYSATGTHQCGLESHSCIVTGSGFSNCNDAVTTLRAQDCCPTTPGGGKSSGFTINYCIPDRPR
jgi:hypothetical protein